MAIVIKPITVEVSKPNVFQAIAAKQNDSNSRFLKVTFVNEGEKIYVTPSARVTINAERNDGQSNSFFGEVNNDGTVTVPIHSWILELPGYVDCDVSIIEADSKLTSTTFTLLVEEASHGDGAVSEDPQANALGELIKEVEALETGMNEIFANAIKNTTSGTAIALTDISPLEHILRVKARSKNILNLSRCAFVNCTHNADVNGITSDIQNGYFCTIRFAYLNDFLMANKGKTFTLSTTSSIASDKVVAIVIAGKFPDSRIVQEVNSERGENSVSITIDKDFLSIDYVELRLNRDRGATHTDTTSVFADLQLEQNSTATPYKPYVDVSTAKVQRYGGNIFDYTLPYTASKKLDINTGELVNWGATWCVYDYIEILGGISFGASLSLGGKGCGICFYDENKVFISGKGNDEGITFTTPTNCKYMRIAALIADAPKAMIVVGEHTQTQLEQMGYEPYKEPITYPINTDGTVEGVTSLYPTTTLISDTEGIVLDVEYNADTKKYIDNKFAELAAMIVNS